MSKKWSERTNYHKLSIKRQFAMTHTHRGAKCLVGDDVFLIDATLHTVEAIRRVWPERKFGNTAADSLVSGAISLKGVLLSKQEGFLLGYIEAEAKTVLPGRVTERALFYGEGARKGSHDKVHPVVPGITLSRGSGQDGSPPTAHISPRTISIISILTKLLK